MANAIRSGNPSALRMIGTGGRIRRREINSLVIRAKRGDRDASLELFKLFVGAVLNCRDDGASLDSVSPVPVYYVAERLEQVIAGVDPTKALNLSRKRGAPKGRRGAARDPQIVHLMAKEVANRESVREAAQIAAKQFHVVGRRAEQIYAGFAGTEMLVQLYRKQFQRETKS